MIFNCAGGVVSAPCSARVFHSSAPLGRARIRAALRCAVLLPRLLPSLVRGRPTSGCSAQSYGALLDPKRCAPVPRGPSALLSSPLRAAKATGDPRPSEGRRELRFKRVAPSVPGHAPRKHQLNIFNKLTMHYHLRTYKIYTNCPSVKDG
ncbi:hypothetical protein NDU88_004247 [Pleurodeles waltl]|uniref:Uncharacterized protein n=1 Tax=Pleurodeles waltl TaxID=8319 RepID=A0AAV7L453_PLEWA|nr:hypothetical protein NDU88_004247 [Pleurodeles waltl]